MNRNNLCDIEKKTTLAKNLEAAAWQDYLLNYKDSMPKENAVIRWFAFRDDDDAYWGENPYNKLLSGYGTVKFDPSVNYNSWKAGDVKYLKVLGNFICTTLNFDGTDSYQGIKFVLNDQAIAWYYATAEEVGKYYYLDQELWCDKTSDRDENGHWINRTERNYEEMFGMSEKDTSIHFLSPEDYDESFLTKALCKGEGKVIDCDGWSSFKYPNWNKPMHFTKESLKEWGKKYPYGETELPDVVSW